MKCRLLILWILFSLRAGAEIRWSGWSGNGNWGDPGNWESGILPGPDDDVLLDNFFQLTGYNVQLPAYAVIVRSLRIAPGNLQIITLELPVTNTTSSSSGSLLERAFTTTGNGYTLIMERGGVFINASGSSSGYSLRINDSIQVRNGGKYTHRSRTGHAELVEALSKATGTERGIFRFENSDAASTISLSGRVYGDLQFSAAGYNIGLVSYSASGTNPVIIRGDLSFEPGANLALNFDDTVHVKGNLYLNQATLNLASGNRSSVLLLEGNWTQIGGLITETNLLQSTGTILMQGAAAQIINSNGLLSDSVIVDIKNSRGVTLEKPLYCSFGFRLSSGQLHTSDLQLLTLAPKAWLQADSLADKNFIDGPVRKEGLANQYFLFPVGGNGQLRWMSLYNASGNFTVTYHALSAYSVSTILGAGIDHLSRMEFWTVNSPAAGTGQVELSFDQENSGGVSELVSLRVSAFQTDSWIDQGNLATTGQAFVSGSVLSAPIAELGLGKVYFTLASSSGFTNVLPYVSLDQWMDFSANNWYCNWRIKTDLEITSYELELSVDGRNYEMISRLEPGSGKDFYRQSIPTDWSSGFCRIIYFTNNQQRINGEPMRFFKRQPWAQHRILHMAGSKVIQVESMREQELLLELLDGSGHLLQRRFCKVYHGITSLSVINRDLPAGIYWLRLSSKDTAPVTSALIF